MRLHRAFGLAFALGVTAVTSAHVGSSNAYFEGMAGPFPVRVIIRMPGRTPEGTWPGIGLGGETKEKAQGDHPWAYQESDDQNREDQCSSGNANAASEPG